LSGAYLLLNAASYDGEILHSDAYRPYAGHLLGFMSIGVVVTKIMTFLKKMRQIGLDFCCGESPQAAGRSVGPYALGLYQPAGSLAAAARWAAKPRCSGPTVRNSLFLITESKTAAEITIKIMLSDSMFKLVLKSEAEFYQNYERQQQSVTNLAVSVRWG